MFTGIIEGTGRVVSVEETNGGRRLGVSADLATDGLDTGESIAVAGACMTVVSSQSGSFVFDVSAESLRRTTLGAFAEGDAVNLERSLKFGDRLGGHMVNGHIDGLGRLAARRAEGDSTLLTFEVPQELTRLTVEKGSVAIDGVSLTCFSCRKDSFEVAVVPHTLEVTTLGGLGEGQRVNVETDVLGRYVAKLVEPVLASRA
ncbi:MAG: riboflavin synthase [Deltaproteobacteria bacterium]